MVVDHLAEKGVMEPELYESPFVDVQDTLVGRFAYRNVLLRAS